MKINYNSPFWQRMEKLYYIIILNVLWVMFCLPILTIGPSTAALYSTTINLARGNDIHVFKDFLLAFKQNFIRNMLVGLMVVAFCLLLLAVQNFYLQLATSISPVIYYLYIFVGILFLLLLIYIFPVLSGNNGSLIEVLRISLFLSIKSLPMTILMLVLNLLILYLCQIVIPLAFTGMALIAFINSHIILKKVIYKSIEPSINNRV